MRFAVIILSLTWAASLALASGGALAQGQEITLTEADPPDGAQLDAAPEVVRLCFSEVVEIEDNSTFNFRYLMPDGRGLGLRIVFQPDGECVDVFPGLPDERPAGVYTFEWQVSAAEGEGQGSGVLRFAVGEDVTVTPAAGETPGPTGTPAEGAGGADSTASEGDDGGFNVGLAVGIGLGSFAGVAALFAAAVYLLRRRSAGGA